MDTSLYTQSSHLRKQDVSDILHLDACSCDRTGGKDLDVDLFSQVSDEWPKFFNSGVRKINSLELILWRHYWKRGIEDQVLRYITCDIVPSRKLSNHHHQFCFIAKADLESHDKERNQNFGFLADSDKASRIQVGHQTLP